MLSSTYMIILYLKNKGLEMELKLRSIIKKQMKSLFIGAVINETSLEDYAFTKELTAYKGGYEAHILCVMQRNIDIVKIDFPQLYSKYRTELISQIQGKTKHDIFMVCDKYIKSFFSIKRYNYAGISNALQQFKCCDSNMHITNTQKLAKVKEIIEGNLYPIFTSFALDLDMCETENNLQKYVELKNLLNIQEGIGIESAIKYDKFKQYDKKRYKLLMDKLDDRMIALRNRNFYGEGGISNYMFMSAFYSIYIFEVSVDMTDHDYNKMLDEVKNYMFTSG